MPAADEGLPAALRRSGPRVRVHTLANGVRVLTLPMPRLASTCVSVFVRSGSRHEAPRQNGISHVVEHMAFKGTATRSCQQINWDAERLGAEVNAHTDRDHTAYHMRGLAHHAPQLVAMLGDIVRHGSFPADELERERQVILHELTEVEDDPAAVAFQLFDRCCHGRHATAQPVIGRRANIERFSRDELLGWVQRQYTGANTVVAIAGPADARLMAAAVAAARQAFGDMPAGQPQPPAAPVWQGGFAARRHTGSSQVQAVLGFPIPGLAQPHAAAVLAAAVLGEGMSSPLMDEIREKRGLCYYASCSADVLDGHGQWVIEAATGARQLDELLATTAQLMRRLARKVAPEQLERARHQLLVRQLAALEQPFRSLEAAVQDLWVLGRVRQPAELWQALAAVDARQVRQAVAAALRARPALALAGQPGRGLNAQVLDRFRA